MREKVLILVSLIISSGIGFMIGQIILIKTQKPSLIVRQVIDRSLDKYTIKNLTNQFTAQKGSQIARVKILKDYLKFTSNEFMIDLDSKKVSGMLNIPKGERRFPLIVMIRGYVDSKDYFIGNGTINSSIFFANHGFITISPDFLGYGESSPEPDNIFEARFQTYTTLTTLLKSVNSIPEWDGKNIFVWAHSNGGQIALSTLEITGVNYPTVLWAPVSSSFPFSILYYTDEAIDHGKSLRRELSKFEEIYNTDLYSLTNYLSQIKAPIELDQGSLDSSVPVQWSDNLAKILKDQGLSVDYNVYLGADHQMTPLWNTVIQKDLEFFNSKLKL